MIFSKKSSEWDQQFFGIPEPNCIKQKKSDTKLRKAIAVEKSLDEVSSRVSIRNSYRTISKVFAIDKSTITTIYQNRSLSFLLNFSFRNILGVESFFFTSRTFHIIRKFWRITGLTITVNLFTYICCIFFVCWRCGIWKSCFEIIGILFVARHV